MSIFGKLIRAIELAPDMINPEAVALRAIAEKRKAEHAATQERGAAAFLAYHKNSPFAHAKLKAGMTFTPEVVAYMEMENENRRIAAQIFEENTKDIDNAYGNAETVPSGGDVRSSSPAWNVSRGAGTVQD